MSVEAPVLPLTIARDDGLTADERDRLERRARRLSQLGLAWHLLEASVAIAAGVVAGSVALTAFGADSLIEAAAGLVVIWLLSGGRAQSRQAERRAQQWIAATFVLLAGYTAVAGMYDLIGGHHPATSWPGIALAVITLVAMPSLATAKRRVGQALGSHATTSESRQNLLCAYLSAGLLVGLLANAVAGWWWADPAAALLIGVVALREARAAWQGDSCDCC